MGFFKVDTSEENVKDYSGGDGKYITKSGMYEVILKAVWVDSTPNGSEHINLLIEYNGQEQPLFQAMRLTNNDGSKNLGQGLFTKLCVVCGATDGAEVSDPITRNLPVGEKGAEKECSVLADFDNQPVILRIQMEYGIYQGNIQQRKNVRNIFRVPDKATASEILNSPKEEYGQQYEKELEFAENITYKDDVTEEDVKAWIKNRKSGKKEAGDKKPAGGFGGKKFGKK